MYDEDTGEGEAGFLLSVIVPDIQFQTRIIVKKSDSVFSAKQAVISKLSKKLPYDSLNYGLYLRAISGRPGKFLDDGRLLTEYALAGISQLEFLYKRRDYTFCSHLSEKAIIKANNKSIQKKLIDFVAHGSVKKIEKLLDSGLDPNFLNEEGNTPLGLVCGRNGRAECITALMSGGAFIDFRGSGGLTPIHRAAIGGNTQATKNLLALGSSPNYTDDKGLTPLYHAAIMGDDVSVTEALLKHKAVIGQTDQIGWTELHQIAKHGNTHLVDVMLQYGVDIDAQNDAGNTPLHVAAQHGKAEMAIHLLKRGADRDICNSSNQPPNQVAILCGHRLLAKEILNFSSQKKEPLKVQIRQTPTKMGATASISTVSPPYSTSTLPSKGKKANRPDHSELHLSNGKIWPQKVSTLPRNFHSQDDSSQEDIEEIEPVHLSTGSSSSNSSQSSPQRHQRYSETRRKNVSPGPTPRERLYACTPGKRYTVTNDVVSQQKGDLSLTKGMSVEVLYIGKGNYWEGKVGDKHGWFPKSAITTLSDAALSNATNSSNKKSPLTKPSSEDTTKEELLPTRSSQQPPRTPENKMIRNITIHRGPKGFGFAMRGVKSVSIKTFKPDSDVPALQYVGEVDKGGSADCAGLEQGDFMIEVNGVDTTYATHEDVVDVIKKSGGTLHMKVMIPTRKPNSKTSAGEGKKKSNTKQNSPKANQGEAKKLSTSQSSPAHSTAVDKSPASKPLPSTSEAAIDLKQETFENNSQQNLQQSTEDKTPPKQSPPLYNSSKGPRNGSKKGKESPMNQSPLLHSIRYEEKIEDEKTTDTEDLKLKEKEQFETQLKEEALEEEELSSLAKQLRQATLDRYSRGSNDTNKANKDTDKTRSPKTAHTPTGNTKGPAISQDEVSTFKQSEIKQPASLSIQTRHEMNSISSEKSPSKFPSSSSKDLDDSDISDDDDDWTEVEINDTAKDELKIPPLGNGLSKNSPPVWKNIKDLERKESPMLRSLSPLKKSTPNKVTESSKSDRIGQSSPKHTVSGKTKEVKESTMSPSLKNSNTKPAQVTLKSPVAKSQPVTQPVVATKPPPVAAKPPPIAAKPTRNKTTNPTPDKVAQSSDESKEVTSFPVLSLKEKFESMSNPGASAKLHANSSSLGSPLLPLSSQRNRNKEQTVTVDCKSSTKTTPSRQLLAITNKEQVHPPKPVPPLQLDDQDSELVDLPPPLSYYDDEDYSHSGEFSSPPPPLPPMLTDTSGSEEEEEGGEYVPPPPPLYDDMDDEDIFDDNPPIHDVPVSLDKLMDVDETFSDPEEKDGPNLLNDIVGQLKTLMTSTGNSSGESDDESDEVPPPLPSSPPPGEDHLPGEFPPRTNELPPPDNLPPPQDDLPPPQDDLPPPQDELPPPQDDLPPPQDELPPPHDELLPPYEDLPLPHDDLPPPQDDILPPHEDLPPPHEDELPPPNFDGDSQSQEDLDFLPPPLDVLPPPLDVLPPPMSSIEEFDLPEAADLVMLPPPLEALEDDESLEKVPGLDFPPPSLLASSENDSKNSPFQMHLDVSEKNKVEFQPSPLSFESKPLDSWTLDDVCTWMAEVGLDTHIDTFRENEIVGEHLRDLSRDDLKDLGICKVGHIKTFKQKLEPYLTS